MVFFLQTEFVTKSFELSADTVFGLLVAGQSLVIIALAGAIAYLFKMYQNLVVAATIGLNATAERLEAIENKLNDR